MKKVTFISCLALVLLVLNISAANAQTLITGDIAGRVVDKTGAIIPGATLTLRSNADGSTQVTKSSDSGNFRFPLLRPGSYSIHEEGSGMSANVSNVAVNVGQATAIDIVAGVAGNNVVVEVNTNQPLLQSEDGNISTTFSTDQLTALPIPGGDISNLPFSTPGVSLSNGAGYGNFTAFGLPSTSNLYTTNGSDLMDAYLNLPNSGASNNVLGANELQEAAVVVNGYTGQYGRLSGAQVNFTTISGSNQFHGNLNYYYNGSVLNANDWFLNNTDTPRPHAVSNQWGARIGGPVWKDKLFFFADSEGLRYVLPSNASPVYLPSSQFAAASLANIAATQPSEAAFFKNVYGLYASAPGVSRATPSTSSDGGCGDFAGTKVGSQTFGGGAGQTPCSITFTPTNNNINTEQLYSVRVDANLTKNDKLDGRFKHDWGVQATSTDPINNAFSANSIQPEYEGQGHETHIFSANIVNSFGIDGMYYSAIFGPPDFAKAIATFPTTFSFKNGDRFANLGGTDNTFPSGRNVATYQVQDDLSITHGRHSIKTGFNFRRYNITNFAPLTGYTGSTTFNSMTDFFNGTVSANGKNPSTTTQAFPAIGQAHMALYAIGVYVQDQIALTPNFNLTASLRFDRGSNPSCGNNCYVRLAAPFDSLTHGVSIPYNQSILTGNSNAINDVEKVTIQPRIGFAYTPFGSNGKTVIRGGAGLFSDTPVISAYSRFTSNAPNTSSFTFTPAAPTKNPDGSTTPGPASPVQPGLAGSSYASLALSNNAFQNGFHNGQTLAQIQTAVVAAGSKFSPPNYTASTTNKLLNPKFAEYNLEIQQQITRHDVVDINYVGNIGTDILFLNPTANAYAACFAAGTCPNGFVGLPTTQPDLRFRAVTTLTNNGHSNYNGLIVSLRHQGGYGITAAINYTYSHSLDNTSNGGVEGYTYNGSNGAANVLSQIDPTSVDRLNYGTSDYDNKHNLSANYVWQLPYRFHSMIGKTALEGWAISGVLYAKSGAPYSVVQSGLAAGITGSTDAGSFLGTFLGGSRAACGNPNDTCLLASQFAAAPNSSGQYQIGFGNLSRNSFRGPDYFDTDMQLSKTTAVTERVKLKLGANFFNILNHPNFAPPDNDLANSTFGTIQGDIPPVSSPYGNFQGAGVSGRLVQVMGGITF